MKVGREVMRSLSLLCSMLTVKAYIFIFAYPKNSGIPLLYIFFSIAYNLMSIFHLNIKVCILYSHKMQVKTLDRYHLTPVRMVVIDKPKNKWWQGCDKRDQLHAVGVNIN
jgi:hypothetical protein